MHLHYDDYEDKLSSSVSYRFELCMKRAFQLSSVYFMFSICINEGGTTRQQWHPISARYHIQFNPMRIWNHNVKLSTSLKIKSSGNFHFICHNSEKSECDENSPGYYSFIEELFLIFLFISQCYYYFYISFVHIISYHLKKNSPFSAQSFRFDMQIEDNNIIKLINWMYYS